MANRVHHPPHLIYTVGTRVVALIDAVGGDGRMKHPRGAVGVVVKSAADLSHGYRVRFPDGYEHHFARDQVTMLTAYKEGGGIDDAWGELSGRIVYRCIVGSQAFGLAGADSDVDKRGIYLPTADRHWSLAGVPEQLENDETQEAYWELQKFLTMALKANPNVLECLYTPLVELATPLAEELLANRHRFLSRLVYQTYNGYVLSQFKKMQADLRNHGAVKWKHVMHLLRLLISGIGVLRDGAVVVRVEEHRDHLLAIKAGALPWKETEAWRQQLHTEFEEALVRTRLPERPDYDWPNDFLIRARRLACETGLP